MSQRASSAFICCWSSDAAENMKGNMVQLLGGGRNEKDKPWAETYTAHLTLGNALHKIGTRNLISFFFLSPQNYLQINTLYYNTNKTIHLPSWNTSTDYNNTSFFFTQLRGLCLGPTPRLWSSPNHVTAPLCRKTLLRPPLCSPSPPRTPKVSILFCSTFNSRCTYGKVNNE